MTALKGYGLLDTPNEAAFDKIVREAAVALGAPIALISLIDENRQWFKAKVGLAPSETPRSISFCTHAIRGKATFVVENAAEDDRFAANPLVTGDPHIRFYAGVPLRSATGLRIGTLCVIDSKPRGITLDQQRRLEALAARTMEIMEKRSAVATAGQLNRLGSRGTSYV